MRNLHVIFLSAALMTTIACGGGAPAAKPGDKPATTAAPAPAAPATPAAPAAPAADAVKAEYKPAEVWSEIGTMSHMDRMTKFRDGVVVTGVVAKIKDDPAGEYGLEMDAGSNHVVEVRFADFGKAAKDKGVKVGDSITATKCSPTNPEGDRMAMVTCELKG